MTTQDILASQALRALCNAIVPPCSDADGAASAIVQERLLTIYCHYRTNDQYALTSFWEAVQIGVGEQHPYFPTFAETVMEAYWTSDLGLSLVGFNVAKSHPS